MLQSLLDLICVGVGLMLGAGVFVTTGVVAQELAGGCHHCRQQQQHGRLKVLCSSILEEGDVVVGLVSRFLVA